ncbi:MAG: HTH-type transcriptional regulator CueR [Pseudomonas citronellolis]|nr:MAG: HTH-type transcriptional regulator CueR [Pseudomonas citronellolis]
MNTLDIAQVARRSGLPASTLRYYEERGLIRAIGRDGLKRVFDAGVLQRLALIGLGREAGFALDEIAPMLDSAADNPEDRQRLHQRADALDAQIKRLGALRDGLRHVADCSQPGHLQCPTFQRLLRVAGHRGRRQSKP